MDSLPLAPVPNSRPRGASGGMVVAPEGWGFLVRDWLNTALGEGAGLLIALVAAALAALSLSAGFVRSIWQGATRGSALASPPRPGARPLPQPQEVE